MVISLEQQRELCVWLGVWKPEQKCTAPKKPVDDNEFGDVWCPECKQVFGCGDHDSEPPDLTADSAYPAIIKGLNEKGYEITFAPHGVVEICGPAQVVAESFLDAAYVAYLRDKEQ